MKKAIFFLFVFLSYIPALAQVDTAWVRRYNGPVNGYDNARAIAMDSSGNVYVTGYSYGSGLNYDYTTIKYSSTGDTLWVRRYNGLGNGNDYARAIVVDDSGNVYITGEGVTGSTLNDYVTIKYSAEGDTLWVRSYNGPGNDADYASALEMDASGNVYVTGSSAQNSVPYPSINNYDYATIKYAPNGDTLWIRRYNGTGNYYDHAYALTVDDSGNVYVAGESWGEGVNHSDYATIKYAPNGDTLWVRRYHGPENFGDVGDQAYALAVDVSGNVYVTGRSNEGITSYSDYATIKYAANGDTLWVRRYNGPFYGLDFAYALAVDDSGNVYVTGRSQGIRTGDDYATIKYTPYGDTLWVRRYDGPSNGHDEAYALALDDSGNVYVTGWSNVNAFAYVTIKYSPYGNILWIRRDGVLGSFDAFATAISVDKSGNVYVTGTSVGSGTSNDYATVKYVQFACTAKPGDANNDDQLLLSDIVTVINFLFKSQPAPNPSCRADANADGNVSFPDIIYLINSIFRSGPAPQKSRECCL